MDLLMKRYSQGNPLRRSIQQVLLYEASGGGGPISIPSSTSGTTMPSTQPGTAPATSSGVYARDMDSVSWGLNIRSSKDASSRANIITAVKAGTQLMLLDPAEVSKIGGENQWVHVREPGGREGFVAAQYLERVGAATPASPSTPAASSPGPSTTSGTSGTTSTPDPSTTPGTTTPPAAPARLILVVSEEVGTSGLRLRKTPSLRGAILKVLQAGTELTVLEPEGKARAKLGQSNKWIQVSEPGGPGLIEELRALGNNISRENVLDLLLKSPTDVRISVLVSLARPVMDYSFFQLLSERIDRARGDGRTRLVEVRTKLLELTQEVDQQVALRKQEAVQLIDELL